MEILHKITDECIFKSRHKTLLRTVETAVKQGISLMRANLRGTYLRGCDLREADLKGCDLRDSDLRGCDLRGCDLKGSDLRGCDLRDSDLSRSDLRGCDLREADLSRSDLRGANLDFSVLPLWCGAFNMKVDDRFVAQLICHITRLDVSACSEGAKEAVGTLDKWKNEFCKYRTDVTGI